MSRRKLKLTVVVEKGEDGWFTGQLVEFPAAISQGKTLEELQENLLEALHLVLDYEHEKAARELEAGKSLVDLELV
jgi:predicted RNase H-like HicB family nuclease